MIIRSLWRGLGRNTPAPNRSMSKRPAPVAIISIAQQASPNVIGHSADLRAQFTTGAPISIAFAATVRRTKFVIESTVVRTNPSSCSAMLRPFERAFAPRVVVTNNQDTDEDKHLDQRELSERKIITHENDSPRQQKDRLHVENQKQ